MDQPADFRIEGRREPVLALTGDWTATGLGRAPERLAAALRGEVAGRLDLSGLGRFDTSGALVLARQGRATPQTSGLDARPDVARLLALVEARYPEQADGPAPKPAERRHDWHVLERLGHGTVHFLVDAFYTFAFYGRLLAALARLAVHPSRFRLAPTTALMERAGLDALPIVAITNLFVGATIAFLGADLLAQFGAQIFTVELIGVAVLREFGVLITAVLLAGRSGSSFAAELGAMKMNQEVDAMQVIGVDPFEALVLPRFVAMLLMEPLLTFVAMISGLAGGILVVWTVVGLSPAFFLQRLLDNVGIRHFWLGMVKAPVLAVIIAAIGCRQGFEVGGDVEQLGRRVTSSVVQAIFAIILVDAVFAVLFLAIGL